MTSRSQPPSFLPSSSSSSSSSSALAVIFGWPLPRQVQSREPEEEEARLAAGGAYSGPFRNLGPCELLECEPTVSHKLSVEFPNGNARWEGAGSPRQLPWHRAAAGWSGTAQGASAKAAGSLEDGATETGMGTDPSDSEGSGMMAEPALGPCLEETEAVGPGTTSLHAHPRQGVNLEWEQPCWGAVVLSVCEEEEEEEEEMAEQDPAGLVVPAVTCLLHQGGSGLEEGTTPAACVEEEEEEGGRSHNPRTEGERVAPLPGPTLSTAPTPPEPEGLLPRAQEGDRGGPSGSTAGAGRSPSTETGQELPLGDSAGAGALVGFGEDRAQCRGQQREAVAAEATEDEEETAQFCCIQAEDPHEEQECPICTELYDQEGRRPSPLNCGHVLCSQCLHAILEAGSAADIGRVRCPICRQKTPMMEWEICRLQEELLLLGATQGPATGPLAPLFFSPLPTRRPGFWGGLEYHFQLRFHTTRMIGFLPCLRYPPRLIRGLARLEGRCRWGYRLALVALMAAETLSLLVVFLPVALLLLLFLIMDQ